MRLEDLLRVIPASRLFLEDPSSAGIIQRSGLFRGQSKERKKKKKSMPKVGHAEWLD